MIREPARFIDSFGSTRFQFMMASELMDSVGKIRIRTGEIEAQKPVIIKPESMSEVSFDGFSDSSRKEAEKLLSWLKQQGADLAFLKYGFQFKKTELKQEIVHDSMEGVIAKLEAEADRKVDPALAILEGVDDSWEVGLFKFTLQMINRSSGTNLTDFVRRRLI